MPTALKDLLGSEKGVFALLVLLATTAFTLAGKMTVAEWQNATIWTLGIYTGGKTALGVATVISGKATPSTTPTALAAPAAPTSATSDSASIT